MRFALPLLLAAALALPAGAADPDDGLPALRPSQVASMKDLQARGMQALQAGDPDQAARAYRRALAIHSGHAEAWYNLACAEARRGQPARALAALEAARQAGWSDPYWPPQDEDLAELHATPGFEAWLETVRASATVPEAWPQPDPATLAADPQSLEAAAAAWQDRIDAVKPALGRPGLVRANRRLAAWTAASWDLIASRAGDPEQRTQARLEALRAVAGSDPTSLSPVAAAEALRRAELLLAEPACAGHGRVRLVAAQARLVLGRAEAGGDEDRLAAVHEDYEQDLLLLAASLMSDEALGDVLVDLMGSLDAPEAARLHQRLVEAVPDPQERRKLMLADSATAGLHYVLEGLPPFEARTLDGATITDASLPGRVTLLDFWATWCGPCRAELPHLKAAREGYGARGLEIVGVSLDHEKDKDATGFREWCAANGVTWPQVFEGKGWDGALVKAFGVTSIPFPLLVAEDGRVLAAGADCRGDRLEATLLEALGPEPMAVGGQ